MTTAKAMLVLSSFRDGVAQVFELTNEHGALLGESLLRGIPERPPELSQEEWRRAVSSFRFLWEIASREGKDAVVAEVREAFPEVSDDRIASLSGLLESNALIEERVRGIRRRDGFLPIVTESRVSLDLRVLDAEAETDGPTVVVPVVTVRLEFDETVGGGEAIVFQLPFGQLDDLKSQLEQVGQRFRDAGKIVALADVPDWSLEGTES